MFNSKSITPYLLNPRPNKQGIYFAYTSIVDFEVGLSKLNEDQSISTEMNTNPIRAKLYGKSLSHLNDHFAVFRGELELEIFSSILTINNSHHQ